MKRGQSMFDVCEPIHRISSLAPLYAFFAHAVYLQDDILPSRL